MNDIETLVKSSIDTAKLAMLEFDAKLVEQFSPKIDHVCITIHPDEYTRLEKELNNETVLIFETTESPVLKIHSLNKAVEVANGQELSKLIFKLKVIKKTQIDYVNFIVGSLATLHTYLSKEKAAISNMTSYEDGNKQFFIEVNSIQVGFSKRGFAETQELETLKKKLHTEIDAKLRVMADYQNFKKRTDQQNRDTTETANKNLLLQVMEIIDDCNRALQNEPNETVSLLLSKLMQILLEQGLEQIEIKKGDKFNPQTMEALTSAPSEEFKTNSVIHTDQSGYIYKTSKQVFRPAKVIVAK